MSSKLSIGNYLLDRLAQLGVKCMFGVPGDFNLAFLDLVEDHPEIDWIGNCNELGAAYAADGYARIKEGSLGVVLTTFGVGELSAVNGIAGAFSEHVPVLHIVGVPSTLQQKTKPLLHHTLGDGRFDAYYNVAKEVTVAQANLTNAETAAQDIDRALIACVTKARPVYIMIPTDMVTTSVTPSTSLESLLSTPLNLSIPPNDSEVEAFVLDQIVSLVENAFSPSDGSVVVLLDACSIRHGVRKEVAELLEKTGFPVYTAPMGKTAVDEGHERYGGSYIGSSTQPGTKENVEGANLILSIGGLKSDFNTGNFTYKIPTRKTVELHSDHTLIQYASYPNIGMKSLLPKLTEKLARFESKGRALTVPKHELPVPKISLDEKTITQTWMWARFGEFFREKDVLVAETGTSSFGLLDVPLPKDAVFVSQILWGSIGWTVGSTLGAAEAAREINLGRTMLFIGDGSLQLMVQELSTIIRSNLKPIIFVLNNDGYTIERFIHGWERKYNDISSWKWTALLDTLSSSTHPIPHASYGPIRTPAELSALLDDAEFAKADKIQLVEIILDKFDAPRALRAQTGH